MGDTSIAKDYDAFRAEVRAFLEKELTPDMRRRARREAGAYAHPPLALEWHRKLAAKGWIAPSWPVDHGGAGWDAVERLIFETESARAGAPLIVPSGTIMLGPVLMAYGSPTQKDYFLPRILSGECYFCQGFSEPNAGSDLAALSTRAERDGDVYLVNGSKIWTTHAHHANWMFLLARTSQAGKPQAGISFLLLRMDSPGISVRPIVSLSGEHEVNQVFFDNVRVPVDQRVGAENEGWTVTKRMLEYERGGLIYSAMAMSLLHEAQAIAEAQPGDEAPTLSQDVTFRLRAAELEIDILAQSAGEEQMAAAIARGERIGDAAAAIQKIAGTETMQAAAELCADALGRYAIADQRACLYGAEDAAPIGPDYAARPVAKYLNSRASSIYAGTNEILRTLIARTALGLRS